LNSSRVLALWLIDHSHITNINSLSGRDLDNSLDLAILIIDPGVCKLL